jgi:ribonuclease P protein component
MLSAENRLKKTKEINRVFSKGKFGGGGPITAKALQNRLKVSRAVVIVSKKISKRAVVRNRIRRRVLGWLQPNWATVEPGYDIVVTVRDDISELETTAIAHSIETSLKRAGVIQK